nr:MULTISPECIES: phage tail protein [unclassified Janthinobacterium]
MMVALLAWLKVHQLDLMTNEKTRKHGIAFKFEFNNRETVDISIKLNLTERIAVKPARPVAWTSSIRPR